MLWFHQGFLTLDPPEIEQKRDMKQLSTCVHWDFPELPFLSAPCLNLRALSD